MLNLCELTYIVLSYPANLLSILVVYLYFLLPFCAIRYHSIFSSVLQIPSYVLMCIPHDSSEQTLLLSPLGEACAKVDLNAIHEILEKVGYKDDDGAPNDVRY